MAPKKNIFEKSIILNKLDWELFLKKFERRLKNETIDEFIAKEITPIAGFTISNSTFYRKLKKQNSLQTNQVEIVDLEQVTNPISSFQSFSQCISITLKNIGSINIQSDDAELSVAKILNYLKNEEC